MLRRWSAACVVAALAATSSAQRTVYVDADAPGSATGESWADAMVDLQAALDQLEPGDTLLSRGDFTASARVNIAGITWLGSEDTADPTWIRGDRQLTGWEEIDAGRGIWRVVDASLQLEENEPAAVVFDYQRDTLDGAVTGVDLRPHLASLPANGAGVYFGHLPRVADVTDVSAQDQARGAWSYDPMTDTLVVRLPEGRAFDAGLVGVCRSRVNAVDIAASDVLISGVNTILTPGFEANTGYGFKGVTTVNNSAVHNADIVDSGWHAAGFVAASPSNCTLSDLRAWSSGVDGSNLNNPFVFYANVPLPNSGHRGEDLTYYAYPLLGTDGSPIYTTFKPRLGLSHGASPTSGPTGIEWHRCSMLLFEDQLEARHNVDLTVEASSITGVPLGTNSTGLAEDAEIRVYDSRFEGAGPSRGIAWFRTAFEPRATDDTVREVMTVSSDTWLTACTIDVFGPFVPTESAVFELTTDASLTVDLTTVRIRSGNGGMQVFRTDGGGATVRQSAFVSEEPAAITFSWPGAWSILPNILDASDNLYSGFTLGVRHSNPGVTPRPLAYWESSIDTQSTWATASLEDGTLAPTQPLPIVSTLLPAFTGEIGIDDAAYSGVFGAHQARCRADTNNDGTVSPADFNAWIIAFNDGATACDQNGDMLCTPADFNAWVLNYNAGCP